MIDKRSRYADTRPFSSPGKSEVFRGLRSRQPGPATPVLEHTLGAWDRPDQLANYYYGDPHRWWRLLDANPEWLFAGDLLEASVVGQVLLIPAREE